MPNSRDDVFSRVTVDHLLKAGTRVSWRLQPEWAGVSGMLFQLQLGESGIPDADDWQNVGSSGVDVITLIDDGGQRDFGASPSSHYRVKMSVAGHPDHYSQPLSCWGRLNRYDWLRARANVRRELLRHRTLSGAYGWLFKRRKKTETIQSVDVVDFLTKEIIRSEDNGGAGTDKVGGYFAPVYMYMDINPQSSYPRRDEARGPVNDIITTGRAIAYPEMEHGDFWANATSDFRYAIHEVKILGHMRGIPLIVGMTLRQLDLTDPVYDIDLPPVPPLQTQDREEF